MSIAFPDEPSVGWVREPWASISSGGKGGVGWGLSYSKPSLKPQAWMRPCKGLPLATALLQNLMASLHPHAFVHTCPATRPAHRTTLVDVNGTWVTQVTGTLIPWVNGQKVVFPVVVQWSTTLVAAGEDTVLPQGSGPFRIPHAYVQHSMTQLKNLTSMDQKRWS